jgi:hypothetical protein
MRSQKRNQPYRPGAAEMYQQTSLASGHNLRDNHRVSQAYTRTLNTCQSDCQRLAKRALLERHVVWQTVKPGSRMAVVTCEGAVVRWGGEEYDPRT